MQASPHRRLIEEALQRQGTDLSTFVAAGRSQGKTMDEIWMDLRQVTEIRFSIRSLYRWIDEPQAVRHP